MIRYLIPAVLLIAAMGCGGPSPHDGPPGGGPGGPPPGAAQEMSPAQRLEKTMQDLTVRLKLKPEQAEKVKAIIKAGEDKKEKMLSEGERSDNPREMQKLFERVHQVDLETQAVLGKVLTKDQLDEYKDYLKEQRRRFETGKKPGNAPPGGGRPSGRPGGGPGGV
ncbi:MAG: hypothetical protein KKC30_17265 [Proteobacteria bacterium]|nr:hypothetical protein [Pseudomonadota bacterium]MBU4382130.1 hypothetical protein [Pseudomonadota bacterium]MBU4604951.1 hypothetical protein [Pseudomonadota bacterium]MCG2763006.1 hypothetical protein [Desulfarculaceae bacterium]